MGNCSKCFQKPLQQVPASPPTGDGVQPGQQTPASAPRGGVVQPGQQKPASATTLEEVVQPGQQTASSSASSAQQTPASAPTLEEVVKSLKEVSDLPDLNKFVHTVKQLLEEKTSDKGSTSKSAENRNMLTSFFTSGVKFLNFANEHTEKIEDKKDIFYSGNSRVVAEIIGQVGQLHWVVGALSITAYLIEKIDKISVNKAEALNLLSHMVDLAGTLLKIRDVIPEEEEKFKKAVILVVQGSIMCGSQIYSEGFFSFLKTEVNSKNLEEMSRTLDYLYKDINLAILTEMAKRQSEMAGQQSEMADKQSEMADEQSEIAKRQPKWLPVQKPEYSKDAVGIENAREEVTKLLTTTEDDSTIAVVIYGFGGIGKTTMANDVVAMFNLEGFNYSRVYLEEDERKNNLIEIQKVILKDLFPNYHSGDKINLRDCQEGQDCLKKAFLCAGNKPVFLFIDNCLRSKDLETLLPADLSGLPKRSKILLTTRKLDATDVFLTSGVKRKHFSMKTLPKDDAIKILCIDADIRERITYEDMERILRICGGVPLALRIVRGRLVKMGYNVGNCNQILDALEKGGHVKEQDLSQRVIQFVYNELEESTKEAFLDICCFFNRNNRRDVEYVVGADEVKSLEEAGLVTQFLGDDKYPIIDRDEERLSVHDIVRAKGRRLSESTRFTFTDVGSFSEAAQDKTKLKGIKGLWFDNKSSSKYVVDVELLNSMRHSLRILHLGWKVRTSAQSPMKFMKLRYLFVEDHIPMKVEELDMLGWYHGPIGRNGMSMNKLPKRLRMLNQSTFQSEFETLSIQNHSVEELYLSGLNLLEQIKQFPEGLNQLCSLKILTLRMFSEIEEFPEQICELSSLIKLSVSRWARLKHLPQSFGRLKGLTLLQISFCPELEELPPSFGQLTALEHLDLSCCPKLKELPGGLESLEYLNVSFCWKLKELPGGLESLKYLNVRGCKNLKEFPGGLESKPDFRIVGGHGIR